MSDLYIETNNFWDTGKTAESIQKELEDIARDIRGAMKLIERNSFIRAYGATVQRQKINVDALADTVGRVASYYFRTAEVYELNELVLKSYVDGIVGSGEKAELPPSGCEVIGDPYRLAPKVDSSQGDNKYNISGNCGLVTIANLFVYLGYNITEEHMVEIGLNYNDHVGEDGGTTTSTQKELIEQIIINGTTFTAEIKTPENGGSYEDIARYLEDGKAVEMDLSAYNLWNKKNPSNDINHAVCITGAVRDKETGKVKGFYICDSGSIADDSCRYVSVEAMDRCYKNVGGNIVVVTANK